LSLFVAEIDFKSQQLVGFGNSLGDKDLRDAQVDFSEVVDGDVLGSLGSCACRCI